MGRAATGRVASLGSDGELRQRGRVADLCGNGEEGRPLCCLRRRGGLGALAAMESGGDGEGCYGEGC